MVKKAKKPAAIKSRLDNIKDAVGEATASLAEDIDNAKEKAVREIREGFDAVSLKATKARQATAKATENVKGSFTEVHPVELIRELADEVEEIAEGIIEGISAKFNQLREAVVTKPSPKKTVKKSAKKEKGVAKRATAKKQAAVRKAATKKKATPKKKAAVKKAASKKASTGKAVSKKRVPVKKAASRQ